jgi:hypothetical protein
MVNFSFSFSYLSVLINKNNFSQHIRGLFKNLRFTPLFEQSNIYHVTFFYQYNF